MQSHSSEKPYVKEKKKARKYRKYKLCSVSVKQSKHKDHLIEHSKPKVRILKKIKVNTCVNPKCTYPVGFPHKANVEKNVGRCFVYCHCEGILKIDFKKKVLTEDYEDYTEELKYWNSCMKMIEQYELKDLNIVRTNTWLILILRHLLNHFIRNTGNFTNVASLRCFKIPDEILYLWMIYLGEMRRKECNATTGNTTFFMLCLSCVLRHFCGRNQSINSKFACSFCAFFHLNAERSLNYIDNHIIILCRIGLKVILESDRNRYLSILKLLLKDFNSLIGEYHKTPSSAVLHQAA